MQPKTSHPAPRPVFRVEPGITGGGAVRHSELETSTTGLLVVQGFRRIDNVDICFYRDGQGSSFRVNAAEARALAAELVVIADLMEASE